MEWLPYGIKIPKASGFRPGDGRILDKVYHVVHAPTSCHIFQEGRLKAGLIYDESVLRKSRIAVTWLSANTWGPGSIYGNVQFAFSWAEQIEGRSFYWVEAMTNYSPKAYRILATKRDLSWSKYVKPYDPSADKGPLRRSGNDWYWNDQFTSEFMIEGDIDLADCTDFDFITHNDRICRLTGSSCPDMAAPTHRIGARVIAFLLGNSLHSIDHVLKRRSRFDPESELSDAVELGIDGIIRALGARSDWFGGALRSTQSGMAVLRGALALYGNGKRKAARELVAVLYSRKTFEKALTALVNEHFGITRWTIPE
jgi:hypothetical protein